MGELIGRDSLTMSVAVAGIRVVAVEIGNSGL